MVDRDDIEEESEDSALEEAHPTCEEVLAEINRIRKEIQKLPGRSEFNNHSKYSTEAVYHHFEWYGDAIKAARSAKNSIGDHSNQFEDRSKTALSEQSSEDDSSEVIKSNNTQIEQETRPDDESGTDDPGAESKAPDQSASMEEHIPESAAETDGKQTITVRIIDDGTPLRGAHVTVGDDDTTTRQTDEQGIVEIPVSKATDQVSVNVIHRRWTKKDLDIPSGTDTEPQLLEFPRSEWRTDVSQTQPAEESEAEDEPSDVISTILQDIERLDDS